MMWEYDSEWCHNISAFMIEIIQQRETDGWLFMAAVPHQTDRYVTLLFRKIEDRRILTGDQE